MKLTRSTTPQVKRKGFTLIELLVSMTVTMVIIGVLMAMTRVAVNGMVASQNATRSSRISQEVLTTVSKDLEGIVIRTGNKHEWVSVKENTDGADEFGPGDNKDIQNPIDISFFSAVTDRYNGNIGVDGIDNGGDISLVRYKLVYKDVISNGTDGFPVYTLYRQRINPDVAFTKYLAPTDAAGDPVGVIPAVTETVTGDDYLAENVYDLTISFNFEKTDARGATTFRRVPIQTNGGVKGLSIKGNEITLTKSGGATETLDGFRLSSADLSLFILSDKGMNGLERAKIGNNKEFSAYLKKHGKHFSKQVILPRP